MHTYERPAMPGKPLHLLAEELRRMAESLARQPQQDAAFWRRQQELARQVARSWEVK